MQKLPFSNSSYRWVKSFSKSALVSWAQKQLAVKKFKELSNDVAQAPNGDGPSSPMVQKTSAIYQEIV
jgi:hypothetical protein